MNPLIQAELERIEAEAVDKSRKLLKVQNELIAGSALVELLKQNGADETLSATPCYHFNNAAIIIYPSRRDDRATLAAIRAAGLEIVSCRPGFNPEVLHLTLRGYEGVEVYVDAVAAQMLIQEAA